MSDSLIQVKAEQALLAALYQLGDLLSDQATPEEVAPLRALQVEKLQCLIMTPKWALLGDSFSLSQRALSLLAIVYMFQLEPDLISRYTRLSWFEQGPGVSAKRALYLAIEEGDNVSYSSKQLVTASSVLVETRLLVCSDVANPIQQTLTVSEPLFEFMVAQSESDHAFQAHYDVEGWLMKIVDAASPATAAVYREQFAFPSSGLNLVNAEQKEEALAFIHSLLQDVQLQGVNVGGLWLVHTPLEGEISAQHLQQALLATQLNNMPAIQAVYWPSLWQDCMSSAPLRVLAEFLIRTPYILLFCHPHDSLQNETETFWVRESTKGVTSHYVLNAATAQLAQGWLELCHAEGQPGAITTNQAQQLADRYPLASWQMAEAFQQALIENPGVISFVNLQKACLNSMSAQTNGLARFSLPSITLSDMVLKDVVKDQLEEILARMQYRTELESQTTGFLMGTQALFWGPPGTGKTMAAEAIAGELNLPLYKVNLSNVASKWIGETEKHLAHLFDRAEKQQAVLLFDEADAIFAKRSEVESSHDKNANMGVSFLLQRMESYQGVLLLSTNFKANIDDAFLRRFTAVSEFPLPDEASRKILWERVWQGSLQPADDIDMTYLAIEFELSPSQIRNIAERACLLALMAFEKVITKPILAKALRREFDKQSAGFLASKSLVDWLK